MKVKRWMTMIVMAMAMMAFSSSAAMADHHLKGEAKTEAKTEEAKTEQACPLTSALNGIGALIEGIFTGIGSLFGGGK